MTQTIDIRCSNNKSLSNVPVLYQRGQWIIHPTLFRGQLVTKDIIRQQQNKRRNEKRQVSKPVPTERQTLYTIALDTRLGLLDRDKFFVTVKGNNFKTLKKLVDYLIASFDQEKIRVKDREYIRQIVFPQLKEKLQTLSGYYCIGAIPVKPR